VSPRDGKSKFKPAACFDRAIDPTSCGCAEMPAIDLEQHGADERPNRTALMTGSGLLSRFFISKLIARSARA